VENLLGFPPRRLLYAAIDGLLLLYHLFGPCHDATNILSDVGIRTSTLSPTFL
jgi:hypothetical protein